MTRLASWSAEIGVEADRLYREIVELEMRARRYGAPDAVLTKFVDARIALSGAHIAALTLYPETTCTE